MNPEELQAEIDTLREKLNQANSDNHRLDFSLRCIAAELKEVEGCLRRGMPVHPDYIQELREELEADIGSHNLDHQANPDIS